MCSQCPQKTIWDRPDGLDWNAEPPELRALGKVHAERVWLRQMEIVMQESIAELEWEKANLSPEENARLNSERMAVLEDAINRNEDVIKSRNNRGR